MKDDKDIDLIGKNWTQYNEREGAVGGGILIVIFAVFAVIGYFIAAGLH